MDFIPIRQWFKELEYEHFIIIAGPCAAESKEQVLSTAEEIKKIDKVRIFRAGLWKPRTSPHSFEGVGEEGIEWLKEVKSKYQLLIATEVAKPVHIERLLSSGAVDIFWIGARSVSNPFSIQELAEAVRGVDIPILVKNPIHPDLRLWIGAIERFLKAGVKKIGAIHRGFYPFERSKLRNIPKWEIAIELKVQMKDLPIIGDPSHIAGDKKFIPEIAQYGIDLNFDGLMIETHINPLRALSDSKQQLTPLELKKILEVLVFKRRNIKSTSELEQYRQQIDSIDYQIIELLYKRMQIVKNIGIFKKRTSIPIFDLERWIEIRESRLEFARKLGLDIEFMKKILQLIHKQSITEQQKIKNGKDKQK